MIPRYSADFGREAWAGVPCESLRRSCRLLPGPLARHHPLAEETLTTAA